MNGGLATTSLHRTGKAGCGGGNSLPPCERRPRSAARSRVNHDRALWSTPTKRGQAGTERPVANPPCCVAIKFASHSLCRSHLPPGVRRRRADSRITTNRYARGLCATNPGSPHLCRAFDRARIERALPPEPEQGADRPLGRVRSADADRLRQRPRARQRRSRQGRRAGLAHRRHARAVRRHSARRDEHVDDHQRHRGVAAGAYVALADEQNVPRKTLTGTTQNDIIKEYLSRGTYVFPPEPSMRLTRDVICSGGWLNKSRPRSRHRRLRRKHVGAARGGIP